MRQEGRSLIAHTGAFDHLQHAEFKHGGDAGKEFRKSRAMARRLIVDLEAARDFVDENPEYVLMLASDHGVDEQSTTGYRMHGTSKDGNMGFLLLYSSRLAPGPLREIDIVDVCPTISTYLKGVDIPAMAVGVPRTQFTEKVGRSSACACACACAWSWSWSLL